MTIPRTSVPTGNSRAVINKWDNLPNGETGDPMPFSQYADKSIQVIGTFGVGGNVAFQGSNNGQDWAILTDAQGNDLNITSPKIKMVTEATLYVRPVVTGDGTTSLSVILFAKE